MDSLLKHFTNLHFTAFFIVIALASGVLAAGKVGEGSWQSVMETAITVFIGSGALKELAVAVISLRGKEQ